MNVNSLRGENERKKKLERFFVNIIYFAYGNNNVFKSLQVPPGALLIPKHNKIAHFFVVLL